MFSSNSAKTQPECPKGPFERGQRLRFTEEMARVPSKEEHGMVAS